MNNTSSDDRWRGGRSYEQNRLGQRHPASGPRDRMMGSQGGLRGGHGANHSALGVVHEQTITGPPQEQHISVRGFNANECRGALKRAPTEPKPATYKPAGKDVNNNRGAWASKPNTMANGKDFFIELRKQVSSLRQGGNVAGG